MSRVYGLSGPPQEHRHEHYCVEPTAEGAKCGIRGYCVCRCGARKYPGKQWEEPRGDDTSTSPSVVGGVTFAPAVPMSPAQYRTLPDTMPPAGEARACIDKHAALTSEDVERLASPHRFGSVQ